MRHNYTRPQRPLGILACALAVAACRDKPAAPAGPTIQIALDDATRTVAIDRPIPLTQLIDAAPAAWIEVRAETGDERWLELATPATSYRGSEIRLYLDQGRPAIGVFPPVTPDMPAAVAAIARQPTASLTGIARVQVITRLPELPALAVEVAGQPRPVSSDQLRGLHGFTGGTRKPQGWPLADVIALVAPDHPATAVHVFGAAETLTVTPQELRDPARIFVLKPNRQGEYVFRVWESGGRSPLHEVRRVTKLVVD